MGGRIIGGLMMLCCTIVGAPLGGGLVSSGKRPCLPGTARLWLASAACWRPGSHDERTLAHAPCALRRPA
jgi:hypothetical protein